MEVKRKPKESISILIRRFTQRVRESGILIDAKKGKFQQKKQSRAERRKSAVTRERKKKERQRLKKLGRL